MSTPLQPLGDYVVAQAEEAPTKTASGILLTASATEKPKTAKVLAVGKDVKQIKVGDSIIFKPYATTEVKLNFGKDEYVLVKEEDIVATVK
ncbi:MAG TPA: co-chaperone GroES [Candidatus Saccharimonadales bacterium]|nr:co-chaperone GroES [Candidatus Saccharimonadales bacterium]